MDNLSLRYYKKPQKKSLSKFKKTFFNNSKKNIIIAVIGTLIFLSSIYSIFFSSTKLVQDIYEWRNEETSTYYYSETGPFYALVGNKKILSNKIENKWLVNLGNIERSTKVGFGQYNNFFLFENFQDPNKFINITPKYDTSDKFELLVNDSFDTSSYEYIVKLKDIKSDVKLLNKGLVVYAANSPFNSCLRIIEPENILKCIGNFGNKTSDILDLDVLVNDNQKYKIATNKLINYSGKVLLNCKINEIAKIGQNNLSCSPTNDVEVYIQDKLFKLTANIVTDIPILLKQGQNVLSIRGQDNSGNKITETLSFEVAKSFYLDFSPAKERYPLDPKFTLEFNVSVNEKLTIDIESNAKDSQKGYKDFNTNPIDTDFKEIKFIKKSVEFSPDSNSLVFQFDPRSSKNNNNEKLYPPIINSVFSISSESGKKANVECRLVIEVNSELIDKSSCKIKYLNN